MTGYVMRLARRIPGLRQYLVPILFAPPGHFYSPIPSIARAEADYASLLRRARLVENSIDLNVDGQLALLEKIVEYSRDFDWTETPIEGRRYHLGNEAFGHGDAVTLYGMLRHLNPSRAVEVGSGFSSALMLDANDKSFDGRIRFTFIDPFPSVLNSLLRRDDRENCRVIGDRVQNVPLELFTGLQRNDLLFVDSSHVSKFGSDVNFILFEVLPILRSGVVVHFHDVFWPFEYPLEWIKDGRAWNECYLLRAFLQYNAMFEILFFVSYIATEHAPSVRAKMPIFLKNIGGSLWIRKL